MAIVLDKILTATDVDHRLSFETGSLPYFSFNDGDHHVDFKVLDLTDETTQNLRLYTREKGHPKPVISKGWREYVKNKKLKIGDKITILVNYDGRAPSYSIQAQRFDFRVCGEPLWYNI
ncbi:hypothetical protein ACFE04_024227 [Oxalis oulophora]